MNENSHSNGQSGLEELASRALGEAGADLETWLESEISDPTLRSRVRELVLKSEEMSGFLEQSAAETLAVASPPDVAVPLPVAIGPYHVVRLLGEGGMGVVYLAEQTEPVRRRLALKVLRPSLVTPEAVARFEAERSVLARLTHPHIATLYEAGTTDDGARYFAMELVEGAPIHLACEDEQLSVEKRVALFLDVCEGVQHAHQKGILHRDLKPSNVLVTRRDDELVAKVIDFGIARALNEEVTIGGPVGTPAYMSPEDRNTDERAVPDIRSDVYSLAILLHEMLVGRRPEELASLDQQPLPRELDSDLRAILGKAGAWDPEDRYATVADLAADLRRWLRHEVVEASHPGPFLRFYKLVRRHRAAILILMALLIGGVGTIMGMMHAERQTEAARLAQAQSEELVNLLVEVFQARSPAHNLGREVTVTEVFEQATRRISTDFSDQPVLRARMAGVMGEVLMQLGEYGAAEPLLRESLKAMQQKDPTADTGSGAETRDLQAAHHNLGLLVQSTGRNEEAEEHLRRAVTVAELLSDDGEALATALLDLAVWALGERQLEVAEPLFRRSLSLRRGLPGNQSLGIAEVLTKLGYLLHLRGEMEEAETVQRESLAIYRNVAPLDPRLADCLENLGFLLLERGQLSEAQPLYLEALKIRELMFGLDHPSAINTLLGLARIARLEKRLGQAEELSVRLVSLTEKHFGLEHPLVGRYLNVLGWGYWQQDRYQEAEQIFQRTVRIYQQGEDSKCPGLGTSLANLGLALWKLEDLEGAEERLRRSLEVWQKDVRQDRLGRCGSEPRRRVWSLWALAQITFEDGRRQESRELFRQALEIAESPNGFELPMVREDFERCFPGLKPSEPQS